MTEKMIDAVDVCRVARDLAETNPDCIYKVYVNECGKPACHYADGECSNGSEGCIFGQALAALGADYDFLTALDGDEPPLISTVLSGAHGLIKPLPDYELEDWARKLQSMQDQGKTWGEALEEADREYSEIDWDAIYEREV